MIKIPLIINIRQMETAACLHAWNRQGSAHLETYVHVDRADLDQAQELMTMFGELAVVEAAQRADRSRAVGNVIHFCQWRQIERAIEMLSVPHAVGTVH